MSDDPAPHGIQALTELKPGTFTTEMLVDDTRLLGVVTVEQEWIDTTSEFEPDPSWVHVDGHGHEHRWLPDDVERPFRNLLPSVIEVDDAEPHWCELCQGDYQPSHYECRLCGDTVAPQSPHRHGPNRHLALHVDRDEQQPAKLVTAGDE